MSSACTAGKNPRRENPVVPNPHGDKRSELSQNMQIGVQLQRTLRIQCFKNKTALWLCPASRDTHHACIPGRRQLVNGASALRQFVPLRVGRPRLSCQTDGGDPTAQKMAASHAPCRPGRLAKYIPSECRFFVIYINLYNAIITKLTQRNYCKTRQENLNITVHK